MKNKFTLVLIFTTIVLGLLYFISIRESNKNFEEASDFRKMNCSEEVVLLTSDTIIFNTRSEYNQMLHASGEVVYLCEADNDYQKVVFPNMGEVINCSKRLSDWCNIGYIKIPFEYEILG